MSSPLTAHDVRKQPGITSICGTSDVVKVSTVEAAATAVFKTEYFTPEYLLRVKYYRSNIFCLKIPGTENPENPRADQVVHTWSEETLSLSIPICMPNIQV